MKLYHLSRDLNERHVFTPKLPNIPQRDEEMETPRICLSATIKGALSAVPWGGYRFEDNLFETGNGYSSPLIRVYEFDDVGTLTPEYLYRHDLVRDANLTEEYWIIGRDVYPTKSYLIKVTDMRVAPYDNISYEDMELVDREEVDYEDVIDGVFHIVDWMEYEVVPEEYMSMSLYEGSEIDIRDKEYY